mgnify:CR=1 FL=1
MKTINTPITILEFGSAALRMLVYDKIIMNQNFFYEKKIDHSRNQNLASSEKLTNFVIEVEKDLEKHLNEISIIIDSSSVNSLDLSVQKIYDKKIITNKEIDYLINECKNLIKSNYIEKEILHILKSKIIFDDKEIDDFENISIEASKITIEVKFILINKNICDYLRNLFSKKHIVLKNIYCASYIKSLGIIKKINISGYSSFIDIGLNKSCLTIFKEDKLKYINSIHIGGDHITKDISKVLNVDYRKAESLKLKFSKSDKFKISKTNDDLLTKIINSRLEEIIELLFLNCPIIKKDKSFDFGFKLFFTGNGSNVLNDNLLSFGPELNFINEMSIVNEKNRDCCDSAIKFSNLNNDELEDKTKIYSENRGFFEKLFNYFSKN